MIRKLVVAGAIVTGVVALVAGPAFAHVEIEREGEIASNGMVAATISVPNEEPNAGTVKLELVFPDSPKITTAEAGQVPGWVATVQKTPSGDVQSVTWTGGPLTGNETVKLPLSVGPFESNTKTVTFNALQTYDNGDVVRWIEPTPPGGEEPEHPAPVLYVTGKAPAEDHASSPAAQTTSHDSGDDSMSTGAIVAIVIGAIIVIALIVWLVVRSRRRTSTPTG
jgi:uncharacterized protein YcnI